MADLPLIDLGWKAVDPLQMAKAKLDAAFDFFKKIQTPFFCFHDRDIAPEGSTYSETKKNLDHIVAFTWK